MRTKTLTPRRYQLKKESVQILKGSHLWIYRNHISSAAQVFRHGQWLQLIGAQNEVMGYGIYDTEGLIAIRILKRGKTAPSVPWLKERALRALDRRTPLGFFTGAYRAINGESDGFPGIVFDIYGKTGVLQSYSPTVDCLGRFVARFLRRQLGLENIVWKMPAKRIHKADSPRILAGKDPGIVRIREGKMELTVDLTSGQKSGAFLDLRGLRKWLAHQKMPGFRVLNLFSYTGMLGLSAEHAGAKEIWNVDVSEGAISFGKRYHCLDRSRYRFIVADIFDWLQKLSEHEKFDLVIADPPQMATATSQVPNALRAYHKLYRACLKHLTPRGQIVSCCCTSRIPRRIFEHRVKEWLTPNLRFKLSLQPELDHPARIAEADYLKILVFGK